jgi:hypothetical protein
MMTMMMMLMMMMMITKMLMLTRWCCCGVISGRGQGGLSTAAAEQAVRNLEQVEVSWSEALASYDRSSVWGCLIGFWPGSVLGDKSSLRFWP